MINTENRLVPEKDPNWRVLGQRRVFVTLTDTVDLDVIESRVESNGQALLVWSWYWINGRQTASDTEAKLLEALALISGSRLNASALMLVTEVDIDLDVARDSVRRFSRDLRGVLDEILRSGSDKPRLGAQNP